MNLGYYNLTHTTPTNAWDRRAFLHAWWDLYQDDPHWTPPAYPALCKALHAAHNPHLARLQTHWVRTTGLARTSRHQPPGQAWNPGLDMSGAPIFETTVAASLLLLDPRRTDGSAYLALLHAANDGDSLEAHLDQVVETAFEAGATRLVGPTGLSPHLGSGVLLDHWNRLPPLHTAYHPPYLPELLAGLLSPLADRRLYCFNLVGGPVNPPFGPARLVPLDPARLAGDLFELFAQSFDWEALFPPPDPPEARFLIDWLNQWPLHGWLAELEGRPAGFAILGPDFSPALHRAGGGRHLLWRAWLRQATRRPVGAGRLLAGGVASAFRSQGTGRQLVLQSISYAQEVGWETLTAGPFPPGSGPARLMEALGARAEQSYELYEQDLG